MNFDILLEKIEQTHRGLQHQAVRDVNISLTLRNWLIGYYLVEFEQKGDDRAQLTGPLAEVLPGKLGIKGLSESGLKLYRRFYKAYPQFMEAIAHNSESWLPENIRLLLSDEMHKNNNRYVTIRQLSTDEQNVTQYNPTHSSGEVKHEVSPNDVYCSKLIQLTSFAHFVELLKINDETKRKFYELLILRTSPHVSELKRQIEAQAFEKIGLSEKTDTAFTSLQQKIEPQHTVDIIKSAHFFDFLNLSAPQAGEEKTPGPETTPVQRLEQFLLELSKGMCLESRQYKVPVDGRFSFVDLVFYHRFLKCHVLADIRQDVPGAEALEEMNMCVRHFADEVKMPDDNKPIGILISTGGKQNAVEFALDGMDPLLFESVYQPELPAKVEILAFMDNEKAAG